MPSKRELDKEKMFRKIMPSSAVQPKKDTADNQQQGAPFQEDAPPSVEPMEQPQTNAPVKEELVTAEPTATAAAEKAVDTATGAEAPVLVADSQGEAVAPSGGKLSDDAVAALFAQMQAEQQATEPAAQAAPMTEDAAPPADEAETQAPAEENPLSAQPQAETTTPSGGKLSDDAVAALFAQMQAEQQATEPAAQAAPMTEDAAPPADEAETQAPAEENPLSAQPQAETATPSGGKLSDDAVAALFAQMQAEQQATEPAAQAAPMTEDAAPPADEAETQAPAEENPLSAQPQAETAAPSGGKLSDDAVAALFAQMQAEQQATEPAAQAAPMTQDAAPPADEAETQAVEAEPLALTEDNAPIPESETSADSTPALATSADSSNESSQEDGTRDEIPPPAAGSTKLDIAEIYAQQRAKTLVEAEQADTQKVAADLPAAEQIVPDMSAPVAPQYEGTQNADEAPIPINLSAIYMEQVYQQYQKRLNCCPCDKCKDDVMGMALNKVTPRYITSDQMQPSFLKDRAMITECVTALVHSLFVVRRNPKHDSAI